MDVRAQPALPDTTPDPTEMLGATEVGAGVGLNADAWHVYSFADGDALRLRLLMVVGGASVGWCQPLVIPRHRVVAPEPSGAPLSSKPVTKAVR